MSFDDDKADHDVAVCDCGACENRRAARQTHPIVSCRCGVNFDADRWVHAELVGYQPDGAGGLLELRGCTCGSTHSLEIEQSDTRYPDALLSAIERLLMLHPGRRLTLHSDGKVVYLQASEVSVSRSECVGENLPDALQACVEALPPAMKPHDGLLFRLLTDREPAHSHDRDLREHPR